MLSKAFMPIKIFYLVAVSVMLSSVGLANEFEDPDESAKSAWSESGFPRNFRGCEKPTEECFSNAEGAATTFISSLQNYSGKTILPKPIFLCFMRVEASKRDRAFMNWANDNSYKVSATSNIMGLALIWIEAMAEKFPHFASFMAVLGLVGADYVI